MRTFIPSLPLFLFLAWFCRISRETERERERELGLDCCFFLRFSACHIVLPVVEARRRVPLHNVLDVLERIGASGPDDIFPSRLLSEINCHSIFIVVYLSRQLPPRPLSLDNRLINQAFFVAAVTVFCLSSFVERIRRRDGAPWAWLIIVANRLIPHWVWWTLPEISSNRKNRKYLYFNHVVRIC